MDRSCCQQSSTLSQKGNSSSQWDGHECECHGHDHHHSSQRKRRECECHDHDHSSQWDEYECHDHHSLGKQIF
ncbi:hypothetical protein Lalb_Chr21g0314141 [Lupinus albus]|uniref:Uncharacterized protein n=1 Tax=Lupinus albus TaxID=3870 RepID=A0A6A4NKP6_LUPAL|nr:hypothetical protein Lalb_Chr21g0314141 [Lupinus albus]